MADDSGTQPITEDLILSALDLIQLANRQGRRELNDRLIEALRAEVVSARPLEAGQELASTPELPEPPRAIEAPTPPLGPGAPIPADPSHQSAPGPAEAEPGAGHPEALPAPASTWPRPAEPVPPTGPAAPDQAVPPARSDNGLRPPPAPKRRGSGRQPAAAEPGDAALIEGFEAWLAEQVPRLDPKTIKGRVSFLRKLAFVANQSGRGLLEVDRALFERAARSRFSASDYGRVIEGRASASSANTAKTAMANFVEYVRATGIGPEWADPTQGASLPKAASATKAPKSIPWEDAEAFLAVSADLARVALEAHRRGEKAALDRFHNLALWPLRVVVGHVGLLSFHLSGLRIKELVGLRTYDVVLGAEPCLRVFSAKNDKQRTVSIGARLVATLEWYLKEVRPLVPGADESDLFFLDCGAKARRGSFPEGSMRQTVEWLWARYAKGTAYEGTRWHPHVARHTYATAHLDHGTELRVVQAQMGHEHAETTAIYTRPSPAVIQRSAGTLDDSASDAERDLWHPPVDPAEPIGDGDGPTEEPPGE